MKHLRFLLLLAFAAVVARGVDITAPEFTNRTTPIDSDFLIGYRSTDSNVDTSDSRYQLTNLWSAYYKAKADAVYVPLSGIGSTVQAYDADLAAIAALTGTGIYYRSAANTWTLVTVGTGLSFSGGTLTATGSGGMTNPMTTANDIIYGGSGGTPTRGTLGSGLSISGGVLTLDGDLVSLAGAASNGLYYRSAANTWSLVSIGSGLTFTGGTLDSATSGTGDMLAANNLSDLVNKATARTNLGVAIGSDVQAYDADLSALAAVTGTNTLYYRSAANTWTAVTIGGNMTFSGGTLNSTAGGMTNPMTTTNDIIYGGASGVPTRGTLGTGLSISGGALTLDGDLQSLAGASSTGLYYRSATDTWSPVSIGSGITFSSGTLSASASSSSEANAHTFTDASLYGLSAIAAGKIVYLNGSTWAYAQANAQGSSAYAGVVQTVNAGVSTVVVQNGLITGLSGLTAGTWYYLSDTVAGGYTSTAPTTPGTYQQRVFLALTTTTAWVCPFGGFQSNNLTSNSDLATMATGTFKGNVSGSTASPSDVGAQAVYDAVNLQGSDIASASTINLETATGGTVNVTGTTTISTITLAQGHVRRVRFTGALTLTNGANLVLPGGANITTAADDWAEFVGYASSVVRCTHYQKATGSNVAQNYGYIQLLTPDQTDGTNATRITTEGPTYGQVTMKNGVAKASNYVIYRFLVPPDHKNTVTWQGILTIRLNGADTGSHYYEASMADVNSSAGADAPTFSNPIAIQFSGDASGASGDIEISSAVNLNSWATGSTGGHLIVVKLARDGTNAADTSTVDSNIVNFTIRYASTQ